jgi:membrane-bound inhibitor of C-type lysozyme
MKGNAMRALVLSFAALALAGCGGTMASYPGGPTPPGGVSTPRPLPATGTILYSCSDGTQLTVDFQGNSARVAVIGGVAMVLPQAGTAEAPYYSNGRYGLRGGGADAQWEVGRMAPVACRGS